MEQELKQLLLNTLNPNENIRNNAEARLGSIEKNPEVMHVIQVVLMKDKEMVVQQCASIYFMNVLKKNWKAKELDPFIKNLEKQLLGCLMEEAKYPKQAYDEILQLMLGRSEKEDVENLIKEGSVFLGSSNIKEVRAALRLFEGVFKSEELRFNLENILSIIFNMNGFLFMTKFGEVVMIHDYESGKMFMKILARAYSHYQLPEYLLNMQVFENVFQLSIAILAENTNNNWDENFEKMKKWAVFFLFKCANKGLKKYFKNADFIAFIKSANTLKVLFDGFSKIVMEFSSGMQCHPRVPVLACDFFILLAGTKSTKPMIKANYTFLLTNFILPIQSYNEKMRETFEYDEEKYLRDRYNYIGSDLRSETSSLFTEVIQCDREIQANIILNLKAYLDNNKSDPNYIKYKYGIIGLLADVQKSLLKVFGRNGLDAFIGSYIFPELNSPYPFIVSQALYFLSLSEGCLVADSSVFAALKQVIALMSLDQEILPIEACLAMSAFLVNPSLNDALKGFIPGLLEKVLQFSKVYFLESLSSLMDSIIDCFTEEVAGYAPRFVDSLCSNILEHIDSKEEDKISTISGFITTIEKLIMTADSQKDVIRKIFTSASKVIYTIFSSAKEDFYQECFDLMNSFLFILQTVDEHMFAIFNVALSIDKEELCLYPREVSDFIDNFLSFGKAGLINNQSLEKIYNSIDMLISSQPVSEDDLYEEDFEAGCRIIDSLMLNAGSAVHSANQNIIPSLINKIIVNYPNIEEQTYLDIYGLEAIMNCFIIDPICSLSILGDFSNTFFTDLFKKCSKFKRVHDKKVFILFIGQLFKISAGLNLNYEHLNEAFVEILVSLPESIKKRNKLKDDDQKDDYEDLETQEYNDDSDYTIDSLEEDIWFETDLDHFNAYDYVRNMLSSSIPKSIGEMAISRMNKSQITSVKGILEVIQEEQK